MQTAILIVIREDENHVELLRSLTHNPQVESVRVKQFEPDHGGVCIYQP